jgi:hypothetical protein
MIENLITEPHQAAVLLCFLDDRRDGGAGLFCIVLMAPDQAAILLQLLPELSQLAGPCLQPPRRLRFTGEVPPHAGGLARLVHDLMVGERSIVWLKVMDGRYVADVEEPGPRQFRPERRGMR